MSDSGGTEEDLGFYGDGISPLKSAKSSSVESPPSIDKNSKEYFLKFEMLHKTYAKRIIYEFLRCFRNIIILILLIKLLLNCR